MATDRQLEVLTRLCAQQGFKLVRDFEPHLRSDVLGNPRLPGAGEAQLCRERVIAVDPKGRHLAYTVSHELAHGKVGFCDEKDVLLEQATILAEWVDELSK